MKKVWRNNGQLGPDWASASVGLVRQDQHMDLVDDVLLGLQSWFAATADGDWEHEYGVAIRTLDNPGWSLRIDLTRTRLEHREFDRVELSRSEQDWLAVWRTTDSFNAACGPCNLSETVRIFLVWATS